jgi:hypothetical protein
MGSMIERGDDVEGWDKKLEAQEWGREISFQELMKERKRFPVVLHFAPRAFVQVKEERLGDWERMFKQEFGLPVSAGSDDDDDGPYGPQSTVSGSGDGWDDCD